MNFLTDEEREQLKQKHRKERDGRVRDRIKSVILSDHGWTPKKIAEALLISEDAVRNHIQEYKNSKKLKPENGGSTEKLSDEQSESLEKHLETYTYMYVKDIVAYVKATWGISYTIHGMRSWLKRHDFSYKKPSLVPGKANKEQQEQWLTEYESLKENLAFDETICFMDGVHPTHNVQLAYGWIKKGIRKEILTNTGRSRINLSGMIDAVSHDVLIQEDKMLNAQATIAFLKKIEAAYPDKRKIHLFCDNARYYRNKSIKLYLETSRIKMHFLPPYSPNLNPIERLWKWMKERVIYNTYYDCVDAFRSAIFGFFDVLSRAEPTSQLAEDFKSRIRDKFRPIGTLITES